MAKVNDGSAPWSRAFFDLESSYAQNASDKERISGKVAAGRVKPRRVGSAVAGELKQGYGNAACF